jgi:hypothetical protein
MKVKPREALKGFKVLFEEPSPRKICEENCYEVY